jgi:selenium-binding protein 1
MIVPGLRSSRIHILDISDPRAPRIKNVIEAEEVKEKLGLSALPGGDRTTEIVQ